MVLSILCVSTYYSLSLVLDTITSQLNSSFLGLSVPASVPTAQSVPSMQPEGAC